MSVWSCIHAGHLKQLRLLHSARCRYLHNTTAFSTATARHSSMSAWQIHKYGGFDQLTLNHAAEIPTITRPWDVLVKVQAASINPIDTMMIGGYGSATLNGMRRVGCEMTRGSEFPLILGRDFAGVVVATGKAVPPTKYRPGDQVWGAGDPSRSGTFAEYTTVNALQLSHRPRSVSAVESATMPYVGATCWAALCVFGCLQPHSLVGKRALVLGGSGGIGTFAIQLLKAWGADVTTTCAGDAVMNVLELGADTAIDYTTQDVYSELQQVQGFDVILDAAGDNSEHALKLLKKYANARYVTLTTPFLSNNDDNIFPLGLIKTGLTLGCRNYKTIQAGQTYRWGLFLPNGNAMKEIAKLVDEGKIRPVLEKVYAFEDLPTAMEKVSAKHNRGKSVLDISGDYVEETVESVEQATQANANG